MSTENKTTEQEMGVLEIVLNEILEEQKQAQKLNADQVTAINQLAVQVSNFNERLENMTVTSPPVATLPIENIVAKGLDEMKIIVSGQPKDITKKYQLLLFPPEDAKLFYKIVFGRWLLIIALMVLIDRVYKWAVHTSDINKEMRLGEMEYELPKKAVNYLPPKQKKSIKKKMDSVLIDSTGRR